MSLMGLTVHGVLFARSLFCFPFPFCMLICVLLVNFNRVFPSKVQVSTVLNIPSAVKALPVCAGSEGVATVTIIDSNDLILDEF